MPESNFEIAKDQNIKQTNMAASPLFSISNCLSFTFSTSDLQEIKVLSVFSIYNMLEGTFCNKKIQGRYLN